MRSWFFPVVVLFAAALGGCVPLLSAASSGTPARQPGPPLQVAASDTLAQGEQIFRIASEESTASYQAQEKWLNWHVPTKAVAKTRAVEGELVLLRGDQPRLAANHFRVDMRELVREVAETPLSPLIPASVLLASRDGAVRSLMEVSRFPFAEFVATRIDGLAGPYVEGGAVRLRVMGNLTIRDVTQPAIFETEATLQGDTLSGSATTQIHMTDFGIEPLRVAAQSRNVMEVEDEVSIVVQFRATTAATQAPSMVLADRHPNLDSTLGMLARLARDRGATEALTEARARGLPVENGRVRVNVQRAPARAEEVKADLVAAGGHIEVENGNIAQVMVPVTAIEEIADIRFVLAVRPPLREEPGAAGGA